MSISWMAYAWKDGPMDSNARYVYLALADYANEAGEAYPSLPTIIRKTRLSESTVRRSIQALEVEGWLKVTRGQGAGITSKYTLKKVSTGNLSEEKVSQGKVSVGQKKGVTQTEKRCQPDKSPTPPIRSNHHLTVSEPSTGANGELVAANYLLEELGVVSDNGTRQVAAEAIRLLAKEGGSVEDATEYILQAGKTAKQSGEIITRFWFSNQRYRPQEANNGNGNRTQQGKGHSIIEAARSAIADFSGEATLDISDGETGGGGRPDSQVLRGQT
jgi:DNA-binding IscR family transcriptional regulator